MNGDDELSLKDITFLRAIRDINGSPERYASTEQGVTPATVTAITEATTLSEEEVAYRLDHSRLGKSGLVTVYEVGSPGDDSASLNSAELTEAGERAIAEAEDRERSVDAEGWRPDQEQSEFDNMQEWEPAEVESGNDTARAEAGARASAVSGSAAHASADSTVAPPTESPEPVATSSGTGQGSTAEESNDDDRLAALEERIEQLEAETAEAAVEPERAADARPEQSADAHPDVDELAEEVAALRETTDRLESTLDDALADLDEIRESETGALDEKREEQFETAVKSMVAFHQLATEVLDVRVENYDPSAGRADPERVEITRNRIGDALGVGQSGGDGKTLEMGDDGNWPDPEEAAAGGRTFTGGGEDDPEAEPQHESDAPDSGVYPPIGGDDSARESAEDAEPEYTPEGESDAPESGVYPPIGGTESEEESDDESDAPDTGVYPPIGEDRNDESTADEPAEEAPTEAELPVSMRPDTDAGEGNITETAAAEGHVVSPIRSTGAGDDSEERLPLDVDPEATLSIRRAVTDPDGTAEERIETNDEAADDSDETWLLDRIDSETALAVREAVVTSDGASLPAATDDPYPEGEAYARIVEEPSSKGASMPPVDGGSPEHVAADDDD